MKNNNRKELLEMALLGIETQLAALSQRRSELYRQLRRTAPRATSAAAAVWRHVAHAQTPPKRSHVSREGRARIARAQRKRWALVRAKARAKKPAKPQKAMAARA